MVKNNELGNHTLGSKYSLCHAIYVPCEDYMYKVLEKKKKNLTHSMGSRKEFNSPMLSSKWHPTPVFLPGESHEQRSLMGYSPQGHKESDTTE